MGEAGAGLLAIGLLVLALAVVHLPLGAYMARVYGGGRHLAVERLVYRVTRVDPDADQRWTGYALSLLGFSAVSVLFLYGFLRLQGDLPLSLGSSGMPADGAFNTAVSFVTNTNWQWYAGESTLGHLVQMAGLAVQNFLSAAVGLAVAVALVRGFARSDTDRLGNFWVDLVRGTVRILLPLAFLAAIVLVAAGAVQNFMSPEQVRTLAGGTQSLVGGPVASQEAIKELGTNGGGFFNANSAHPFENPNPFTNLFEVFLLLLIPSALPRTFGRLIGSTRQGWALLAAMAVLWAGSLVAVTAAEAAHQGTVPQAVGASLEGKEQQFGVWNSALFATATTMTSTGAVDSSHDSYTALGGGVLLLNMLLGEVAPGGTGSGLYGMLVAAVLTVFLAGLMVGRTPEYLGKKIRQRETTFVALYVLAMPFAVLVGTGLAVAFPGPRATVLNPRPHGLSEVLYAYASTGNNNGSAFAGLGTDTVFYNTTLGLAMLVGRFLPIVFVLALAGALARQRPVPVGEGTLPTHGPLFVGMLVGVVLVVAALAFFPGLALGPVAEGLA
ncbi:potassium-transporting ATPase potassium-binding subunit [Streptomyces sulfonofaciens]|uniref:Potassium-transporting ATPase potassium-binding subunit n=1 Tax=Streptomyces sulfonofaciens TaxID=68272 RepID=A0A919FU53_9ACTN|nr:potassium-transporting ATPase subunit KdpA [Streptomyces sulfonofaciens]GHH72652.1 potassium-transporting ATPase potassium-binding subunit [Streptomyces sulfonofaciens]